MVTLNLIICLTKIHNTSTYNKNKISRNNNLFARFVLYSYLELLNDKHILNNSLVTLCDNYVTNAQAIIIVATRLINELLTYYYGMTGCQLFTIGQLHVY